MAKFSKKRSFSKSRSSRGLALFVSLAMLGVCCTLGMLFSHLATMEKRATTGYVDALKARLAALAGIERARCALRQSCLHADCDQIKADWASYYSGSGEINSMAGIPLEQYPQVAQQILPWSCRYSFATILGQAPQERVCSGYAGGSYEPYGELYYLKILDCAGQLNLNCKDNDTLIRVLNNLGAELKYWAAPPSGTVGPHPVLSHIPGLQALVKAGLDPVNNLASKIIAARDELPGGCFTSKAQMGQVWCQVWQEAGLERWGVTAFDVIKDFITCYSRFQQDAWRLSIADPAHPLPENLPGISDIQRDDLYAYVNINTAPLPVLEALIDGVTAQVPVFHTIDNQTTDVVASSLHDETVLHYNMTFVEVNFDFAKSRAREIASQIVSNRPFKTYQQFYDFVDNLSASILPYKPSQYGWLTEDQWERLCRDTLKANFDPNYREHRFNPTAPAALEVSRGDLFAPTGYRCSMPFCFSSLGRFEITCQGIVTANQGRIRARHTIRTTIEIYEVLQHSTQMDFHGGSFENVTSYPENLVDMTDAGIDVTREPYHLGLIAGWLEPRPIEDTQLVEDGLQTKRARVLPYTIFHSNFTGAHPTLQGRNRRGLVPMYEPILFQKLSQSGRIGLMQENRTGEPACKLYKGLFNNTEFNTSLMPDGILNHYTRNRYCIYPASPYIGKTGQHRGVNYQPQYNVAYYEGAVEFWVKLSIDATTPVPCGIIAVTQAFTPPPQTDATPQSKEGVQMFIWKNADTRGRLRLSRIYYGQHFLGGKRVGIGVNDPEKAKLGDKLRTDWNDPRVDKDNLPRFRYCRKELIVDIANWKAHQWHHVILAWRSGRPEAGPADGAMKCWIDGQLPTQYFIPASPDNHQRPDETYEYLPRFAIANLLDPQDSLYLGGIVRFQYEPDGLFKYTQLPLLPLNGTLDGVRFYDCYSEQFPTSFPAADRYYANARYTHYFPVSQDGQPGSIAAGSSLGTLSWTFYEPRRDDLGHVFRPGSHTWLTVSHALGTSTFTLAGDPTQAGYGSAIALSRYPLPRDGQKFYYRVNFTKAPAGIPYLTPPVFESIQITYARYRILGWQEQ